MRDLCQWASELALPSSEFAMSFDENSEITEGMSLTPKGKGLIYEQPR